MKINFQIHEGDLHLRKTEEFPDVDPGDDLRAGVARAYELPVYAVTLAEAAPEDSDDFPAPGAMGVCDDDEEVARALDEDADAWIERGRD